MSAGPGAPTGATGAGTPAPVVVATGQTRYETGEIRLRLDVLAAGLTAAHRELLLDLVRQTAGARGTAWTMSTTSGGRVSIGANTHGHSPVGALVSRLEQAQRHEQLPPLAYRAYSDDVLEDLQDIVMATPELGTFRGACDSRGRVQVADEALHVALAADDPTTAVARLAGLPWTAQLGLLPS